MEKMLYVQCCSCYTIFDKENAAYDCPECEHKNWKAWNPLEEKRKVDTSRAGIIACLRHMTACQFETGEGVNEENGELYGDYINAITLLAWIDKEDNMLHLDDSAKYLYSYEEDEG